MRTFGGGIAKMKKKSRHMILVWLTGLLIAFPALTRAQDSTGLAARADTVALSVLSPEQQADTLIAIARAYLGTPYRLGAEGPDSYDCSSFVQQVYSEIGIYLPRYTWTQIHAGREIPNIQELQRGDLVFFGKKKGVKDIGHIGIVLDVDLPHSNFTFIHCGTSTGVTIAQYSHPYFLMRYITSRRILPDFETR